MVKKQLNKWDLYQFVFRHHDALGTRLYPLTLKC